MRGFHNKKMIFSILLLAAVLVACMLTNGLADGIGERVHVVESGFTVHFPCEVLYVTQNSTTNDEYFQLFGTDTYFAIMQDLKTNSVYLDAIDTNFLWETRVSVLQGIGEDFDMVGMDESSALQYANEFYSILISRGVQTKEKYVIMTDYVPVVVLHAYIQPKDIFMALTVYDNKAIVITVSNLFEDSINANDLKIVIDNIVKGLEFDNCRSGKDESIQEDTQIVSIDEIDVSLTLPAQMEWATRSKGNAAPIEQNYNMSEKTLPTYMESAGYYMMAVDPTSESRVSLISFPAERGKVNSILQTDEELLDGMLEEYEASLSSLMTLQDYWVWRDEKNAIGCCLTKIEYAGQYILNGYTVINGNWYIFIVRDTDKGRLMKTADIVFSGFSVADRNQDSGITIKLGNVTISVPENWEEAGREENQETDSVFYYFDARMKDGTSRFISLTAVDICSLIFGPESTNEQRESFDEVMGEFFSTQAISGAGYVKLEKTTIGGVKFRYYRTGSDVMEAGLIGVVQGYMFMVQWFVPDGEAMTDVVTDEICRFIEYYISITKTVE